VGGAESKGVKWKEASNNTSAFSYDTAGDCMLNSVRQIAKLWNRAQSSEFGGVGVLLLGGVIHSVQQTLGTALDLNMAVRL